MGKWAAHRARKTPVVRSVTGLVTALFAVGACAPDPEQLRAQRTIEAEYDVESGRLELITFDSNDNGTIDTWSYMDGNTVIRIEIDRDEDGTIDRWEYYGEDQTLEKVGFSRGNDGVADAWAFEGEDGEVVRIEISTVGRAGGPVGVLRRGCAGAGRGRRRSRHQAG